MNLRRLFLFVGVFIVLASFRTGQVNDQFCGITNTAFKAGEQIDFTVYYSVAGIYVPAGSASFTTTLEKLNGKDVYHVIGDGRSSPGYEWISKIRDRYESYIDTGTLQPLKFIRNVQEGNYKKYENITFNRETNTAISSDGVFKVPKCVQDVVSSIYFARNIDFSKYKAKDKIPFTMFIDNQVYDMYVRYMGRETLKTQYGKFKAIKLKPLLIEGNVFDGGEKMTVWVSDDKNRIPLRVESPILVGSVKVDLMGYRNLRHPLTAKVR